MALLNLSDSSDDEEESKIASDSALNVIESFEEDIYGSSIETLLSLNSTNHLEQKVAIIDRSILTAIKSYQRSNLISHPSKSISPSQLSQILEHVISSCYLKDKKFSLHLNIVFIMMNLQSPLSQESGLQRVCQYLSQLYKTLSTPKEP